MFFVESGSDLELEEDYTDDYDEFEYGNSSSFDYNFGDDDYDDISLTSHPSDEQLNHMKRCVAMCESLNNDRKEGLLCDATIIIKDKSFAVHKVVLKSSSSYFSAMFTGNFCERNEEKIRMQGVSPETFSIILDYIYCEDITLTFDNVRDVYIAADMMCIDGLTADCKAFVKENWSKCSDIQSVYETAKQLDVRAVTESIMQHARRCLLNRNRDKELREISHTILLASLEGLGRRDSDIWQLCNESSIARNILNWALFKPEERLPDCALKLFSFIRFQFVSDEDFVQLLEIISSKEVSITCDALNSVKGDLLEMFKKSHQTLKDFNFELIVIENSNTVKVNMLNLETRKWEKIACPNIQRLESHVVSNGVLYLFSNVGCTQVNLENMTTHTLPNFPKKRIKSVFSVIDRTVYATAGVEEDTGKVLRSVIVLEPLSGVWRSCSLWKKPKCNSSSVTQGHNIYFVGGKSSRGQKLPSAECFLYNTLNRKIKKVCTLSVKVCEPNLAIHNGILCVFPSPNSELRSVYIEGIDLKHHKLLSEPCFRSLNLFYPILCVCSVEEGILVAHAVETKILVSLFRPSTNPHMKHLGFVSLQYDMQFSNCKVAFNVNLFSTPTSSS